MKHLLRVVAFINVLGLFGLHVAFLVVDVGQDDTVSDSLGNNLLGLFDVFESKFTLDVLKRNLRITDIQFLETKFENSMLKSHNERIVFISFEDGLILGNDTFEVLHVSGLNAVHNLEVWRKWFLQERLAKDLSVWNLSHK